MHCGFVRPIPSRFASLPVAGQLSNNSRPSRRLTRLAMAQLGSASKPHKLRALVERTARAGARTHEMASQITICANMERNEAPPVRSGPEDVSGRFVLSELLRPAELFQLSISVSVTVLHAIGLHSEYS